jgi:hypothetical protein
VRFRAIKLVGHISSRLVKMRNGIVTQKSDGDYSREFAGRQVSRATELIDEEPHEYFS